MHTYSVYDPVRKAYCEVKMNESDVVTYLKSAKKVESKYLELVDKKNKSKENNG